MSPGELQRLRLATQVRSNLFGVVYVLDEPSAGLHPADTEALLTALDRLKASGNSLFVVEHDLDVIRHADWIVDVGPGAGEHGGQILYSGPPAGLEQVEASKTRRYLFRAAVPPRRDRRARRRAGCASTGVTRNNLHELDVAFPLGVFTTVTGVSGSGKSSLVSQALVELVADASRPRRCQTTRTKAKRWSESAVVATERPHRRAAWRRSSAWCASTRSRSAARRARTSRPTPGCSITCAGCSPRPKRRARAATTPGASRSTSRKGRCETCEGEGFVMVELLFLPSVYAPCPTCHGARYNAKTLEINYRGKNIADVLGMTVDAAFEFFADEPHARVARSTWCAKSASATCGSASRRPSSPAARRSASSSRPSCSASQRGTTLYVLDEPTTGLHPADVDKLMAQLDGLVESGNTVIVVEHDMRVVAASDHVIDIGPGAGEEGGRVVAAGTPAEVSPGQQAGPLLSWRASCHRMPRLAFD